MLENELALWLRYESKFERQYDRAYRTWTQYQEGKDKRAKESSRNNISILKCFAYTGFGGRRRCNRRTL